MQPSLTRRLLSYLYPVKVASAPGLTTPELTLYYYWGRWQLSSATALYSDGPAYRPLTTAFGYLGKRMQGRQNMLVFGAGLGSAAAILQKNNITVPTITLVDIDPQVISWGEETLKAMPGTLYEWICSDVQDFVATHRQTYDLLVVDIFQDRIVPAFITGETFLQQCKKLLQPITGVLVLNYIVNNEQNWETSLATIRSVFEVEHIIRIDINRILILKNNA